MRILRRVCQFCPGTGGLENFVLNLAAGQLFATVSHRRNTRRAGVELHGGAGLHVVAVIERFAITEDTICPD